MLATIAIPMKEIRAATIELAYTNKYELPTSATIAPVIFTKEIIKG
jgi:hypothetical protein